MTARHHRPLYKASAFGACDRDIRENCSQFVRRTKSRLARRLCRIAQMKKKNKHHHQQQKLLQATVSRQLISHPPQEKAFMLQVSRHTNLLQIHQKPYNPNTPTTSKSTSPFIATSSPTTQKKSAGVSPRKESRLGALPLGGSSWVVGVKPRWVHR